ncbi:MAG TPA: dihydroorotate dehydrogenase [Chloroflexota bacterium]|nr:dihydroorotate dehydrogenase [Chloroflexota bacterium]
MFDLLPGRLALNNPVMTASGTFGYGTEFAEHGDVSAIGGIVCKGITREPRAGHPPPRIVETAAGALNAIGLANIGMEAAIRDKAPLWADMLTPITVNINGESVEDYAVLARAFTGVPGVAALEVNISCPNVASGGMLFGADPERAAEVTRAVRDATDLPLLVKLTPNVAGVVAVAKAVVEAGAEALTVANTYLGIAIDAATGQPALRNVTGGLSGPAIKPLTLRLVYEVAGTVNVPIIGCGGIMNGRDAAEYLLAGASAVQVGTATLVDPFAPTRIAAELATWLQKSPFASVRDAVGAAHKGSE